ADGATETSFSSVWAGQLVREYCTGKPGLTPFLRSLPRLRRAWLKHVSAQPLPWYAEEKVRSGAFAALLGFTVERAGPECDHYALWSALAVGDCCLFQCRNNSLCAAFPLSSAE